jgi:hypothetical protein
MGYFHFILFSISAVLSRCKLLFDATVRASSFTLALEYFIFLGLLFELCQRFFALCFVGVILALQKGDEMVPGFIV